MTKLFRMMLTPIVGVAIAATATAATPARPARAANDSTTAVAVNTRDGSYVFRFSFSMRPLQGSTVDPTNAAVAAASCANCETVAISVQVVFATGAISDYQPQNLAFADNTLCDGCVTAADAVQMIVGTNGMVHLTPLGYRTVAEIRREVDALRLQPPSIDELQATVDHLIAQLEWVTQTQVVQAGR